MSHLADYLTLLPRNPNNQPAFLKLNRLNFFRTYSIELIQLGKWWLRGQDFFKN